MTTFVCMIERRGRCSAIASLQASDETEAAFEGWRKFHAVAVVDGRTRLPMVRTVDDEGNFSVDGINVCVWRYTG